MKHIETRTCLKFVPKVKKTNFSYNQMSENKNPETRNSETRNLENKNIENDDIFNEIKSNQEIEPFINIFKGPP